MKNFIIKLLIFIAVIAVIGLVGNSDLRDEMAAAGIEYVE